MFKIGDKVVFATEAATINNVYTVINTYEYKAWRGVTYQYIDVVSGLGDELIMYSPWRFKLFVEEPKPIEYDYEMHVDGKPTNIKDMSREQLKEAVIKLIDRIEKIDSLLSPVNIEIEQFRTKD